MKTNKNFKCTILGLGILVLMGCAPLMDAVWKKEDYTSEQPKKMAVVAVSKSLEVRQRLENAIAKEMTKYYPNIVIVKGVTLFPPNSGKSSWSLANVESVIQNEGVESVLTTAVVNSYVTESSTASSYYMPQYYRVGRHLVATYDMVYGYEDQQDVNYVLESSLFDLREGNGKETLVWRVEDKVVNPSSVASGSSTYAKNLIKFMSKNLYPRND